MRVDQLLLQSLSCLHLHASVTYYERNTMECVNVIAHCSLVDSEGGGVVRVLKRLYVLNGTLGDISTKLFHIRINLIDT